MLLPSIRSTRGLLRRCIPLVESTMASRNSSKISKFRAEVTRATEASRSTLTRQSLASLFDRTSPFSQNALPSSFSASGISMAPFSFTTPRNAATEAAPAGDNPDKADGQEEEGASEPVKPRDRGNGDGPGGTSTEGSGSTAGAEAMRELDKDALLAMLAERDLEMEAKEKEVQELHDRILRGYADMENMRERMRREADGVKKFAVQDFAKALLDVGDNMERALAAVPPDYREGKMSSDSEVVGKVMSSLLEGVLMTEKQLLQVFKKYGLERSDPTGNAFDPNVHNALFEVDDPSKQPGTVAVTLKPGYKLHERVIRAADVGVVRAR